MQGWYNWGIWLAGHRGQSDNSGPTPTTAIPATNHNESPFFLSYCRYEPFSGVLHPQLHHHQPALHRGHGEPGIWDIQQHGENLESPGESPSKTLSPIPTFVLYSYLAHLLISFSFTPSSNHCSRTAVLGPSILAADWPCSGKKFRAGNVGACPWARHWCSAPTILRRADHQFLLIIKWKILVVFPSQEVRLNFSERSFFWNSLRNPLINHVSFVMIKQWFSTRSDFAPKGYLTMLGENFCYHNLRVGLLLVHSEEGQRDC